MSTLEGRTVAVTGAGSGLGLSHARYLAGLGANVVVNDLTDAERTVEMIKSDGGRAVAVSGDISSTSTCRRILDVAVETFGDLHAVVNNAGLLRDGAIVAMSDEDFDVVVDVHLGGTFRLVRTAGQYWRAQSKSGEDGVRAIVNTTSAIGLHGNGGQANYAAAKAGIAALTQTAALELARYGVRVNAIAPSARTPAVASIPAIARIMTAPEDEGAFDRFAPAAVSPLVGYLCGTQDRFNGQVFSVFGGHVGLYGGWSLAEEIEHDEQWTVDALAQALASFPEYVEVRKQRIT